MYIYYIYRNVCDMCLPFRLKIKPGDGVAVDFGDRWIESCDSCGQASHNMPLNETTLICW